jgi:putative hemolysin
MIETLTIVIVALAFSAYFSGIEIAFVSSNKLQIELWNKQGLIAGKIFSNFHNKASKFIGFALIGNTLSLVLYGIYMANLLQPLLVQLLPENAEYSFVIIILQTLISTAVVLVTAEFLPKSIFMLNPNKMLSVFAIPTLLLYYIFLPIVTVIVSLSQFIITKILNISFSEDKPVYGFTDLNNYLKNSLKQKSQEEEEKFVPQIFHNALEFKDVKIRECMIPRTEMVAVDIEEGMEGLKKTFIESGHSKILVFKEDIDNIIGYCHSLELFKKPDNIEEILNPIIIVHESMSANEVLVKMKAEHKSIALVVDEFGGTSGLVTIEDIMEEIFGEIQDEHDEEALKEEKIDDNTYIFSARHEVDYLNKKYDFKIPEGEYETLGGYILFANEDIPQINDIIQTDWCKFTVINMIENRIDTVKMELNNQKTI